MNGLHRYKVYCICENPQYYNLIDEVDAKPCRRHVVEVEHNRNLPESLNRLFCAWYLDITTSLGSMFIIHRSSQQHQHRQHGNHESPSFNVKSIMAAIYLVCELRQQHFKLGLVAALQRLDKQGQSREGHCGHERRRHFVLGWIPLILHWLSEFTIEFESRRKAWYWENALQPLNPEDPRGNDNWLLAALPHTSVLLL